MAVYNIFLRPASEKARFSWHLRLSILVVKTSRSERVKRGRGANLLGLLGARRGLEWIVLEGGLLSAPTCGNCGK